MFYLFMIFTDCDTSFQFTYACDKRKIYSIIYIIRNKICVMIINVLLMSLIPSVVFMIIPLKMLIDWYEIYLPLEKKYKRKEITVKASWKIWLTDIGLNLAAVGIMYAALFIDPLF